MLTVPLASKTRRGVKSSNTQGIVRKGQHSNQTPLSGNLGGRMAETLLSQGILTASFWGSLKTADGKTQTVKSSEGKEGGVK